MEKNNLAVLMVDMQEHYLEEIKDVEKLVVAQGEVLKICAKKDIPVGIRLKLAQKVFQRTAKYDKNITQFLKNAL